MNTLRTYFKRANKDLQKPLPVAFHRIVDVRKYLRRFVDTKSLRTRKRRNNVEQCLKVTVFPTEIVRDAGNRGTRDDLIRNNRSKTRARTREYWTTKRGIRRGS